MAFKTLVKRRIEAIREAMEAAGYKKSEAARLLGVSEYSLINWLKRHKELHDLEDKFLSLKNEAYQKQRLSKLNR